MDYTRQNDHYAVRLAGDLLKSCENGTADFLNPASFPYYTQDMLTRRVLGDAGQLQTLLNNAAQGSRYINYAPTYILQDTKRSWFKNIKKDDKEIGCIVYKGLDANGNKLYEMMSPAKKINPGGINESPMTQIPVPDIGIFRKTPTLNPADPKSIEKYVTDVIGNYFNAAFTKTPYYPPQWGSLETEMLSKALNADPSMALRAAQQAYSQATSVRMENTVNQELNNNIREAVRLGLPPFNTNKQDAVIGPVGIGGMGLPNGVDYINSYYNGINGAAKINAAESVIQSGYIPYQTHEAKPKDIENYLIEQYGNIINASLTGMPYSGSITPAQLKTMASSLEAKMANDPGYMSGIVNRAQQNVLGFSYLPFDKNDFITKARDPSSKEYKLLERIIAGHINDILKNNKASFNGEFQKLSGELTENIKKTANAAKAKEAQKAETPAAGKTTDAAGDKTAKTSTAKTSTAKTSTAKSSTAKTSTAKTGTAKTSTAKTSTAKTGTAKSSTAKTSADKTSTAKTSTEKTSTAKSSTGETDASKTSTVKEFELPSVEKSADKKTVTPAATASIVEENETRGERPSFFKEATEFVNRNIIEKKPALILVDTALGAVIDKAKKIVRTNKPVSVAFDIATAALTPNITWKTADYSLKTNVANNVSIGVNREDSKVNVQARQPAKSAARR